MKTSETIIKVLDTATAFFKKVNPPVTHEISMYISLWKKIVMDRLKVELNKSCPTFSLHQVKGCTLLFIYYTLKA